MRKRIESASQTKLLPFLSPKYWPLWLFAGVLRLLTALPYSWQLKMGRCIGWLLFHTSGKSRRTAETNLKLCFPELAAEQRHQLLQHSFASVGIAIFETGMGWWATKTRLQRIPIHIQGLEHVTKALAQGRGVMLCSPHFTTLELAGRLFSERLPIAVMYRPQKKAFLEYLAHRALQKNYKRVIARSDIRGMIAALKQQEVIWYAADVDAGSKNSVFVPFFGVLAASITATPRYAKITGAAAIPAFFYRNQQGGYDVILKPELDNFPSPDIEDDVLRINQTFEEAIRVRPEQYLWQYKRFKTRPLGEQRFYK